MDISIIMPWYNTDIAMTERAINSISNQTVINGVEIVICNDNSDREMHSDLNELLKKYTLPISIVSHLSNRGISSARNSAVSHCSGKWLIWLDADDELILNAIETLKKERSATDADYFISKCLVVNGQNVEFREPSIYYKQYEANKNTTKNPFVTNIFSLQAQMIRKATFVELGGFMTSCGACQGI